MRRRTIWLNLLESCASIPLNLMDVMSPLLELTAWACQQSSPAGPAPSERTGEDQTSVSVHSPGGAGGGDAKGSKGGSNERDDGKESTEGLVQQHSDDQGPETRDQRQARQSEPVWVCVFRITSLSRRGPRELVCLEGPAMYGQERPYMCRRDRAGGKHA